MADAQKITIGSAEGAMKSPAAGAFSLYNEGLRGAGIMASQIAQACVPDMPIPEFVGLSVAVALRHAAWTILCGAGTDALDPVEFGKAAERIAREAIPDFVQQVEAEGQTKQ